MAGYKRTLLLALIVFVFVIIGVFSFSAIEGFQYGDSFGLCMQIITTIGYGNHTPVTAGGQIFCIIYTLVGIPLNLVLLQRLEEHILNGQKLLVTRLERLFYHREPRYVNEKCMLSGILLLLVLILVGAGILTREENWDFIQGVYCYVITFTTVGFGDLIPHHSSKNLFMSIFRPLYYYVGLCAMSNVINSTIGLADSMEDLRRLCMRSWVRQDYRLRDSHGGEGENDKQLDVVPNCSVQEK